MINSKIQQKSYLLDLASISASSGELSKGMPFLSAVITF